MMTKGSVPFRKIKSSTIVEVVVAMVILCTVVLLTFSFLAKFLKKEQLSVYSIVSTTIGSKQSEREEFNPAISMHSKHCKVSCHESIFGDSLLEVEEVYYSRDGKILYKRSRLIPKEESNELMNW